MSIFYFNINDAIILKVIKSETYGKCLLYIIDKTAAYSNRFVIACLELNSIEQIIDEMIRERVEKNFIVYKLSHVDKSAHVISLRNVFYTNSNKSQLHTNIYSSVVSINRADLYRASNSAYLLSNEDRLVEIFLRQFFLDLSERIIDDDVINRFARIEGTILNICDDVSGVEIFCLQCKKNSANELVFDSVRK